MILFCILKEKQVFLLFLKVESRSEGGTSEKREEGGGGGTKLKSKEIKGERREGGEGDNE